MINLKIFKCCNIDYIGGCRITDRHEDGEKEEKSDKETRRTRMKSHFEIKMKADEGKQR